ncbi:MAG: tRNA-dihydrouridine synthase family protein [Planctomycetes bacterium]|nr:tRNA-dihydrouridine synthase family protein [Planctomycetota bacterium]
MIDPTPVAPPRIGPVQLPSAAVLAPLAGYTDHTYRLICRSLGAAYCATEVTLDSSINLSPKLRRKLIHIPPADHPIAGQIMGREAASMATAARHLAAMGCDVIDLNFACPVRKALRRRRGGHMMRDAETAVAVLRAVAAAIDLPLTVKLRKSFHEEDTAHDAFWRIAETAFDVGAAAICVHGRSVEAAYRGPADWAFLAEVKRRFPDRVVFGSGDLLTAADGVRMLRTTGVDGVSFARGALGNPWIFRQFDDLLAGRDGADPDLPEQRRILEMHYALCLESFGPKDGPRMMNRFGIRYARSHPRTKAVRTAFINSDHGQGIPGILETFYDA